MEYKLIKNELEIAMIRHSSLITAYVLRDLTYQIKNVPGLSLLRIDHYAEVLTRLMGGTPAFKGYRGFPNSICTSVNNCIAHGIPTDYIIQPTDLVSLDFGVNYQGFYSDAAKTFIAMPDFDLFRHPELTVKSRMVLLSKELMNEILKVCYEGYSTRDITLIIETFMNAHDFKATLGLGGHGIGHHQHEPPYIANSMKEATDLPLLNGMVICVEPMFSQTEESYIGPDGWSVYSKDGSDACHIENTILISQDGPEVLTDYVVGQIFKVRKNRKRTKKWTQKRK